MVHSHKCAAEVNLSTAYLTWPNISKLLNSKTTTHTANYMKQNQIGVLEKHIHLLLIRKTTYCHSKHTTSMGTKHQPKKFTSTKKKHGPVEKQLQLKVTYHAESPL